MQASATVVGNTDGDRIDVLTFFFQHHAIVFVLGLSFELAEVDGSARFIHIAERNDVFGLRRIVEIHSSLSAATNGGNVEFVVERFVAERAERRHAAESGRGNCPGEETSEEEELASGDKVL
jgi:hypothetical protein